MSAKESADLQAESPRRRGENAAELARLLLCEHGYLAGAYVQAMRRRGVSLDRICLQLLAPAARELRRLWELEECSFEEFSMGMERLLNVLQFVTEAASEECPGAWR
jgi:hypothetical protein